MLKTMKMGFAVAALALGTAFTGGAFAQSADEMMQKSLGVTDAGAVINETFQRAAQPLTDDQKALAIKCWTDSQCETGTGGELTVAYADGFGENVWRRVTAMEYIAQALTYPEIGKILYVSARGDATKAIADMRAYIAQGVDIIVMFGDAGEALLPVVKEAQEAGIIVTVHNGTSVGGTPGTDYLTNIAEDVCKLGQEFVRVISETRPDATGIVQLGGTPGNPLSATWQGCLDQDLGKYPQLTSLGKADTNWTQEGTFEAVSGFLAQNDNIGGYAYEYADGFRGAVRAYESAGRPMDFTVALRTDEQGVFCDWEAANDPNFRIFYSSGQNYQSRIALTAAMMKIAGQDVPANINVPFSMKEVQKGQCNPDLPQEISLSTLIGPDVLAMMFPKS
jgi:ABC-type sugar transport system substrate-binding protein